MDLRSCMSKQKKIERGSIIDFHIRKSLKYNVLTNKKCRWQESLPGLLTVYIQLHKQGKQTEKEASP